MRVMKWIDERLPLFSFLKHHLVDYPAPRNLNYLWNFGSLSGIVLIIMIASGLFLSMHYVPHVDMAFDSVERIMREVNYGWLIRYIHMNGASLFFIVVYLHILRGLYYGSYKPPRELLWIIGVVLLLLMIMTAFMGYVLPWGQMSFWGATVITNLFSAIPVVGESIVTWLWGGFSVDNPTLNRFYSLHFLFPFVIVAVSMLHLMALHQFGSNNPLGIERTSPEDMIPFHPYYTIKDLVGLCVMLLFFSLIIFYAPNFFGEPDNYIPANPLITPPHIVPEWYFLPFYAILRSIPSKLGGVLTMFLSIFVLFILPWLDTSPIRSARFRPYYRYCFWVFVIDIATLGWAGAQPPEGLYIIISRLATAYYFFHFLILLPLLSRVEPRLPLPLSISRPIMILCFFVISSTTHAEEAKTPPPHSWTFQGPFGTYNRAEVQRGLKVFKEVCSTCHALKRVSFRSLKDIGLSETEIKAFASQYEVPDAPNDEGQVLPRKALPSDYFPAPYANEKAARAANNGAFPPDLSVITKARRHGPTYVYALLTGYQDPPADVKVGEGQYYNPYMTGQQIAMIPPLKADLVAYDDGTSPTVEQMAHDVVAFLSWTAEPEAEERKRLGFKVMLYLTVMTILMYFAKRKIWAELGQ